MKSLIKVVAILGLALSSTVANANEFKLGYTYLTKGAHDKAVKAVIQLPVCKSTESIKLKAHRKLYLTAIDLKYRNGEEHTVSFTRKLGMNEETSWRALPLKIKRCVKTITVRGFSRAEGHNRSGVTVLGKN